MGQKVNPIGLRLGIVKTWESRWYADKNYADYILEDYKVRSFIKKKLYHAGVSRIEIERSSKRIRLRIFTSRPGIVIGKKGSEISLLKQEIEKIVTHEVLIDIQEIRKPEIDAQLVADSIAHQLQQRILRFFPATAVIAFQTALGNIHQHLFVQEMKRHLPVRFQSKKRPIAKGIELPGLQLVPKPLRHFNR